MRKPLSKEDLDGMRRESLGDLANRGELPLEMAQTCHPGGPLMIEYLDGLLSIRCAACHRDVASIIVASRPDQSFLANGNENRIWNAANPASMDRT